MTPRQITLIQKSWSQLSPVEDMAARLFYRRLFELAPEVRPSVSLSISEQSDHLLMTLTSAVAELSEIELSEGALQFDDRFMVDFGIAAEFRSEIEAAFLWMMDQVLGDSDAHATWSAWADFLPTLTCCESLELVGA